jgi:transcriptional regulator with XRE-family HTH domain
MKLNQIIGENLKKFRQNLGLNQDQVAEFLSVDRSTISHYENAEREISLVHLKKLSNLFGVELEELLEKDSSLRSANFAFAFRSDGIVQEDLKSIASFQRVVKNYVKMVTLSNEERKSAKA